MIKGEDNRVGEQLHTNFTNLFNNIFNSLAHQLEQPALLRDIAQRIAEQIPENTQTLRQLLIGSALYLENNRNPQALERLDPDIATAIIRSRE